MASTIERVPNVDGIFCSLDMLAMGVMTEARGRGIDVPKKLSVVGSGDLDFSEMLLSA